MGSLARPVNMQEKGHGTEPALSVWEAVPSGPVMCPDLRDGVSASDRKRPHVTGVNGPLMVRPTMVDLRVKRSLLPARHI